MKKKLLIVVGAGASIEFGLPSVAQVDTLFDNSAAPFFSLAIDPTSNLYQHLRNEIQRHYDNGPKPKLKKQVNFEEVLYQLNMLVPYFSDPNHLHGSNALLQARALPEVLLFGQAATQVDGNLLRHLSDTLIDALVDEFIDRCTIATTQKASEIAELGKFLDALADQFDIGIVTLNYDNMFTKARLGLDTGFDGTTGRFVPQSVLTRKEWGFIYHLHGSVHFAMTGHLHEMHGITWRDIPVKDHAVHASGRNSQDSVEGIDFPTSPVVAGYGKTQQVLRQPFRTYFGQLSTLTHEADSVLFLGYGFGDLHLNAAFSDIRDRRRPIVIVDWADADQDPLAFRYDNWSYRLGNTIPTNLPNMSAPGHHAPWSVADLKAANEVEVSQDPALPLAVWYNGMLAACRAPNKILSHLL
jgi:hypothetical protein